MLGFASKRCEVNAKVLDPGTVSAHVRHGFKFREAKIFDFKAIDPW